MKIVSSSLTELKYSSEISMIVCECVFLMQIQTQIKTLHLAWEECAVWDLSTSYQWWTKFNWITRFWLNLKARIWTRVKESKRFKKMSPHMHVTTCHTSWKHNIQDFLRDYETNLLILFSARLLYSFCPRFLQTTAAGLVNGCSRPKNTEHNTPIWKIIALVTCESQDWFFFTA